MDFNTVLTEMANFAGTRSNLDKQFCVAGKQALDWGLSPQATKLSMVPPMVDVSGELGIKACAAPTARK